MRIFRTLLFVPGNNERMLARAASAGADAVVIDLEDAVPAGEARTARALARRAVGQLAAAGVPVFVRVHHARSAQAREDVRAAVRPGLTGIVHPKTERAQDLRSLDVLVREFELATKVRPGDIVTLPLIETPRGVLKAEEIVTASDRVAGLSFGAEDYTAALGVRRSVPALAYARGVIVTVAAANGVPAIDTPYPVLRDSEGLHEEAELAHAMGFRGKYVIHPDQVAPVNDIFTPDAAEVRDARRIVAAAEDAARRQRGAIMLDGRMIDAPVVERARATLALAEAIAGGARASRGELTPAAARSAGDGAVLGPRRPARGRTSRL